MKPWIAATAALALVLGACSQQPAGPTPQSGSDGPAANDPASVARGFYEVYFTLPVGGVPTEENRAKIAPFLTPSLNQLLANAAAAEERHLKKTNNEEPPLIERDPFTSLFEGATAIEGTPVCSWGGDLGADSGSCVVDLKRADASGNSQWKDTLHLKAIDGKWLIDDIAFGGIGDFNPPGTLRGLLSGAIAEAPKE